MNRENIIRMAQEAEIDCDTDGDIWGSTNGALLRFAALVEERTHTNSKARWYQEGVEAEREACAKLAEFTSEEAHKIAASIRARANDVL